MSIQTSRECPCDEPEAEFPKLMVSTTSGVVVLFSDALAGTVVDSGDSEHEVGKHLKKWITKKFVAYNEKIVLENS